MHLASHNKSITILKNDLYNYAKKNPQDFLDAFDDVFVKAQALIAIAEDESEIIYDGSRVRWTDGKQICSIPKGKNWKDYFAEFVTAPENIDVYKELVKIQNDLKKPKGKAKK